MSPYQKDVIDTSLAEFDRQRQMQEQQIRDQAVRAGAFWRRKRRSSIGRVWHRFR
jgi:hypothetical protein